MLTWPVGYYPIISSDSTLHPVSCGVCRAARAACGVHVACMWRVACEAGLLTDVLHRPE